jgi:tRNA threonylcarbamoyladenosine biosynthesis protein TsaE
MKNNTVSRVIENETLMLALGKRLAEACQNQAVIFLHGGLGAGKTTFARGFMRGVGFDGAVKSPTYTLVETYEVPPRKVFHFDFYRVRDADELEFIGIKDYLGQAALCLVEWPEMGAGLLPISDLSCYIEPCSVGRKVKFEAHSERGRQILTRFEHGH